MVVQAVVVCSLAEHLMLASLMRTGPRYRQQKPIPLNRRLRLVSERWALPESEHLRKLLAVLLQQVVQLMV